MNKMKKFRLDHTFFIMPPFFNFWSGSASKIGKTYPKKGTKVGCEFSCAVRAHEYVQGPKQF